MSAFSIDKAPYGTSAPAVTMTALSAPASDTPVVGRGFTCLTAGVVSVVTEADDTVTFTVTTPGLYVGCAIKQVLAATTADLLVYQ